MKLVALDRNQMRGLDATAELMGLNSYQLMERAGIEFAALLEQNIKKNQHILFLCGPGNNGGDGLVACRILATRGYQTSVVTTTSMNKSKFGQYKKILEHMQIPFHTWDEKFSFSPYDILIDCLLGYDQRSAPRSPIKEIVVGVMESEKKVIACDLPTGVNPTTGEVYKHHLKAIETISFVSPKKAFLYPDARAVCGKISIIGIGIPAIAYEQLGLKKGEYLVEGTETFLLE